jgi:hypothetical protein
MCDAASVILSSLLAPVIETFLARFLDTVGQAHGL